MTNFENRYVSPVRTEASVQQVADAFRGNILHIWNTTRVETGAMLMAQSALETGRWRAMWNWNASNIKLPSNAQAESYTCYPLLNEVEVRNGKRVTVWYSDVAELSHKGGSPVGKVYPLPPGHPQSRFLAFDNFYQSAQHKLYFLKRQRYAKALQAALTGSPADYAHELAEAGYYTADEAAYTRGLVSLFHTYLPVIAKAEAPEKLPEKEESDLCEDMALCMRVELPEWLTSRLAILHEQHRSKLWDILRDRT